MPKSLKGFAGRAGCVKGVTLGIGLGLLLHVGAVKPASAVISINFSFSNDPSFGNVPGTVSGRILGLVDNATSAATGVFIDAAPDALGYGPFPVDVFSRFPVITENSFTVIGGVIAAAGFLAQSPDGSGPGSPGPAWLYINSEGNNFLDVNDNSNEKFVWNTEGLNGVTFSSVEVPGPLAISGVAMGIGFSRRLRKRIKGRHQPLISSAMD
jgi:hypothetical protein